MTISKESGSKQSVQNIPLLRDLPAANNPPVYVNRDTELREAITLMMINDFSQLPVMQGERTVEGFVSWRTIGEALALRKDCKVVRDCMDKTVVILDDTEPLLSAVSIIAKKDFILVRNAQDKRIMGLVTTSDITTSFYALAEPFFLIGQIESMLRHIINQQFTLDEIRTAKDPSDIKREVKDASDLSFGEYVRLLENETNWQRFGEYPIAQKVFLKHLRAVKAIRDDVMHFRPRGIPQEEVQALRNLVNFLEHLILI